MRTSLGNEVGSTSGAGSMTKHQERDPTPEDELLVLLRRLNVTEEETDVHFDDRTVFLTFSKGYPVTESEVWDFFNTFSEVWDFFTRRSGNFIKRIQMEEVQEGVQPICARMVALSTSIIPLLRQFDIRTKYVVNGKHIWVKKYVRKNSSPPPRLSS